MLKSIAVTTVLTASLVGQAFAQTNIGPGSSAVSAVLFPLPRS
jgi:hypothetical protein